MNHALAILPLRNLVDADDIDLSFAVWKGSSDSFVVDHNIADNDACQQVSVQIRLLETFKVALPDLSRARRQKRIWEGIILAVFRPPKLMSLAL